VTNLPNQQSTFGPQRSAEAVQTLHDDIRGKWDKLSDLEVGSLTDGDDLVNQVVRLYSLDRASAQREVLALLDGRTV
jgi:hypothetical protein